MSLFVCLSGRQPAGGGDHPTEGAPSSAAEAQREEGGEAGLPGSVLRPHHSAAQVRLLYSKRRRENTTCILEGLTVIDAVSFVSWQVLEEVRLHSCVPQTNPCEWKQRVRPRHFVTLTFL